MPWRKIRAWFRALWYKIGIGFRAANAWARRSRNVKAAVSVAELLGKLTIVVGILSYIVEAPERAKQRHYQAWQLINGARTSPGEAGRSIAIGVLVDDHIEMAELDLTKGNFIGKNFQAAKLPGVDFTSAKVDRADFSCKAGFFVSEHWIPTYNGCWVTNLEGARFVTSRIIGVKFNHANLRDAIFGGSSVGLTTVENSHFDRAEMQGVTVQDSRLSNNTFNYAQMQNSKWLGGALISNNQFIGANFQNARWYGLDFRDGQVADFTDADLTGVRVSDQTVPLQDDELLEDDKRLHKAKLCRTKLSSGLLNRDCR